MEKIRVWDPLVRILHWTLVFCVVSNLLNESGHFAHRTLGIIAACVVAVRIVWGFIGPQYARFSDWFPTPQKLVPYIKALLRNEAPRHVGHNPAGAVMMLILMVTIIGLGTSGFLMTTDAFYENDTLKELHESLVGVLVTCVVVHVAAALFESWKHREDLIGAMFHGKKRPPEVMQDEADKAE